MSYLACHVSKYTRGSVFGLQKHEQREGQNHSNKEIDIEKSKNNLDLLHHEKINYLKTIDSLIEKKKTSPTRVKKNSILMVSSIISSDKNFFNELDHKEQVRFFEENLKFYQERFGKDNVISANIHFDESTPHMHINFVPLTTDGRLSAKDIVNRIALKKLQKDLPEYLKSKGFNIERGVEGNKVKHLKTLEYKKELTKKIENIECIVQNAQKIGIFKKKISLEVEDYNTLINLSKDGLNAIEIYRESESVKALNENSKKEIKSLSEKINNEKAVNFRYYQENKELNLENKKLKNQYSKLVKKYEVVVNGINELGKLDAPNEIKEKIYEKMKEMVKDIENIEKTKVRNSMDLDL